MVSKLSIPICALLAISIVYASGEIFALAHEDLLSSRSSGLHALGSGFLLSWWVARDRAEKSFPVSFDFHFYVVFLWFLVVPYYLLSTRGRAGLGPALLVLFIAALPTLAAVSLLALGS